MTLTFLIHRVELKGSNLKDSFLELAVFLIHRVELKESFGKNLKEVIRCF